MSPSIPSGNSGTVHPSRAGTARATSTNATYFGRDSHPDAKPSERNKDPKRPKPDRTINDYARAAWTAFKNDGLSKQGLKSDALWSGISMALAVLPLLVFSPVVVPIVFGLGIGMRTAFSTHLYLPGNALGPEPKTARFA